MIVLWFAWIINIINGNAHIQPYTADQCVVIYSNMNFECILGFLSFSMLYLRFDIASSSTSTFLIQFIPNNHTRYIQMKFWRYLPTILFPAHRKKTIKINYCHRTQWKMSRLPNASVHTAQCTNAARSYIWVNVWSSQTSKVNLGFKNKQLHSVLSSIVRFLHRFFAFFGALQS